MTQDTITQPDAAPVTGTEAPMPQFYWGTNETDRFTLPDGVQFFEFKPMNEGAKAKFQKMTNKGLRLNQQTQDATIDVDPANERWTLIKESVVGWKLFQRDKNDPRGYSEYPAAVDDDNRRKRQIEEILTNFDAKVIQDLEFKIRIANPWMQSDMTIEGIDEELDRLTKLRKQKLEEEAGEGASANK